MKPLAYLKDTQGVDNAVVNDAYTHYMLNGVAVTKLHAPDNKQVVVTIRTQKLGKKLSGTIYQYGAENAWNASNLNSYLLGKSQEFSVYFNDKAQGQKQLPSWLDRGLQDHMRYFYA
jgi:hypothetical protein